MLRLSAGNLDTQAQVMGTRHCLTYSYCTHIHTAQCYYYCVKPCCGYLHYYPSCHNSLDALGRGGAFYGQGTGPVVLSNVMCTGPELTLLQCHHDALDVVGCTHNQDVSVECAVGEEFSYKL